MNAFCLWGKANFASAIQNSFLWRVWSVKSKKKEQYRSSLTIVSELPTSSLFIPWQEDRGGH